MAGLGTVAGAVYKPAVEMVPTVAFPPATPATCQFTIVFVLLETVAANILVAFTETVAVVGVMATETTGGGGGGVLPPPPQEVRSIVGAIISTANRSVAPLRRRSGELKKIPNNKPNADKPQARGLALVLVLEVRTGCACVVGNVVPNVIVEVMVPFAGGVTEAGFGVQVTPLGRVVGQESVTAELKPPVEVTVTVLVPEAPLVTVTVAGLAESEKFPVPVCVMLNAVTKASDMPAFFVELEMGKSFESVFPAT